MRKVFSFFVMLFLFIAVGLIVYGLLNPWPDAEAALRSRGGNGIPLVVGVDYQYDRENEIWEAVHSRTYIFMPECFVTGSVYRYEESTGSAIVGTAKNVQQGRWFYLVLIVLLLATSYLVRQVLRPKVQNA